MSVEIGGPSAATAPALHDRPTAAADPSQSSVELAGRLEQLTLDPEPRALDLGPHDRALVGHDALDAEVQRGRDGLPGTISSQDRKLRFDLD